MKDQQNSASQRGQIPGFEGRERNASANIPRLHTLEIEDPIFEELYTVHLEEDASGWRGWMPDVPEVACTAETAEDLLEILTDKLQAVLEAEEQEWKRQAGDAAKSGKLDKRREEALADVREGRFTYL